MTNPTPPNWSHRRMRLLVTGRVQGMGFRPAVHRLATSLELGGWVANTPAGATIELEGPPSRLEQFRTRLLAQPPPHAVLESVSPEWLEATGIQRFEIRPSEAREPASTLFPPDLALCDACRSELASERDRRHGYAFINCTDCGPRFAIARELPYDRPATTMAAFRMCAVCQAEYDDPASRRFHAQPNACPDCGPHLRFLPGGAVPSDEPAPPDSDCLRHAADVLLSGGVVAIQSLGGFHLACDAGDTAALA